MSADKAGPGWGRWREAVFATCTAWLILQNVALLALVAWGHPGNALAAGAAVAKTAITQSGQLIMLMLAVALGLALAVCLVHAPSTAAVPTNGEADHERR